MRTTNVRHVVTDLVGDWGLWQLNIVMFSISISLFSALNNLSVSFYAPNIKYWCTDNDTTTTTTSASNQTFKSTDYYCLNGCHNWTFDKSVFKSTIIDEWDLTCDKHGLASLSQSLYMVGYVLGALIFGCLSDRFGRQPILWLTVILEIMAGLSSALAVNIIQFIISRMILAFASNGRLLTTFMLVNECVGTKYRATFGMAVQIGWALGYCLLPGISYMLPNFRHLLLATSIPETIWLVWLIVIPESPRWLLANGQLGRAEREIKRALRLNKLSDNCLDSQPSIELSKIDVTNSDDDNSDEITIKSNNDNNNNRHKPRFYDIFMLPNLRRTTLIMYFTWFVNSFVYYGISLNIGDFGGNLFINFFVAGLIEFPSYLFPLMAFPYIGRRPLTSGLMYLSGLSCLAVIPLLTVPSVWPRLTVALIGKFFITSSYGVIYVYAAEVYPTVVRQVGVGSCSVAARFGSILAPFVKELNIYTGMSVVMSIFGGLSIADGVSAHFLPETRGQQIADTIDEAEQLNRRRTINIKQTNNGAYNLHVTNLIEKT
ncbi:organic cation transporter protein-like [Oppia nitens]|uniref:organic cation transporter protein-like n=1 Tax=Oppia nitens TaxID=1686743 RepID=UPI0023DBF9BC|nr:organic cation transporter protein-like [Oppia nitens]